MKKLNFHIPLYLIMAAAGLTASAAPLTPEAALSRMGNEASPRRVSSTGEKMRLAYTSVAEATGTPSFYVFNKPEGGYVILTADDSLPALLADVEKGSFDFETLPENVRWWLGEYDSQIGWFLSSGMPAEVMPATAAKVSIKDSRHDIAPLVKTQWAQQYPYNILCPTIDDQTCPTGCVATAMAQIAKYHQWPENHGFGQHSYTDEKGLSFSFDFAATQFEWDNMIDSYEYPSSYAQKEAVATLMKACGMAVDMSYNKSASSAFSLVIPHGLTEYFGYAPCVSFILRNTYSTSEWEEAMYQEVACGRPVNYSGVGTLGGHQFVLDGYRTDGLYHLNFGWSGLSDGYYRLTAIDPPALGTGGGAGGFNFSQGAVVYICPPDKAEGLEHLSCLYISGQMKVSKVEYTRNSVDFQISYEGGGIFANTPVNMTGTFGVRVTDELGNIVGIYPYTTLKFEAASASSIDGWASNWATVPLLEEGKYQLYPAYRANGEDWQLVPVYNGKSQFISLTVDANGDYTFASGDLKQLPELEVTELVVPETILKGEDTAFTAEFSNGEAAYNGKVFLYLCGKDGATDSMLAYTDLTAKADSKASCEFNVNFQNEEGEYEVYVADCLQHRISVNFPVTISNEPGSVELTLDGSDPEVSFFDMQGRRLASRPSEAGVYVARRGKDVKKIIVKGL